MTRRRRVIVRLATVGLALTPLIAASPAQAEMAVAGASVYSDSGEGRICVGIPAPDGVNKVWVCTPEEQWYADVIAWLLSMRPG